MRARVGTGLAAFVCALAVGALASANGCKNAAPPAPKVDYCNVEHLAEQNADTSAACATCLAAPTACCDAYGDCQGEPGCESAVAVEYNCLLSKKYLTPALEEFCTAGASPKAKSVYDCMKGSCAEACAIGNLACTPDPAIPTVSNSVCDSCTTTKCCTTINGCYKSRPCKLAFECALGCRTELGALFDDSTTGLGLQLAVNAACEGRDAGFLADQSFGLPCISGCLHDFVLTLGGDAGVAAGCATLELFQCTYDQCRSDCRQDAGASDAGAGAGDAGPGDAADGG